MRDHGGVGRGTALILLVVAVTACGGDVGNGDGSSTTGGGSTMQVRSNAYAEGSPIPVRYTCDGEDVSPPFTIDDIPPQAESLVLIMDDPDAPGDTWVHWVAYDLAVGREVAEGAVVGTQGTNSWGRIGYGGPCPPIGTHRYVTTVYALSRPLGLAEGARKGAVLAAMEGLVVGSGTLIGTYGR